MNGLARFLACSVFFLVCTNLACADTVSVSGYVNFDETNATFHSPFTTATNTDFFSAFSNGTVLYLPGTIPYMVGVLNGDQETFDITNSNGDTLRYFNQQNNPSKSVDASGNLVVTLDESGYYTINNGQHVAGFFDLVLYGTSADGAASNVAFTGYGGLDVPTPEPASLAPEPASILFMGTGILGAALLLRSRNRRLALTTH